MRVPPILAFVLLPTVVLLACTTPPAPEQPSDKIRIVPVTPTTKAPKPGPKTTPEAPRPPALLPPDDATLLADLEAGKSTLGDAPGDQADFERAFLWTFAADKSARNYPNAGSLLRGVLTRHPKHPQSLRALAYVAINQGFDIQSALKLYRQAVDADPDHGPSHYAIAFLLGRTDPVQAKEHFDRAMALGIPDARGLADRYFGGEEKAK
jgi:tetratricopeptide (TPR) repeat protein